MNYSFDELRPRIRAAVDQRFALAHIHEEPDGFVLIEGFTLQSIQPQTGGISIGGNAVPTVLVVGSTTGRIYQFALKALLPDITL